MTTREAVALALFAGGTAWNFGNAGPIVTPISEEFSASLGVVGLISGAALYGALLLATATSPTLTKRAGAANGARAACALGGLGNIIFALAPTLGVALGGRVIAGYGVGSTVVVGPAIARAMGGVRGVGIFGAAIMIGIALALGIGGLLENAGAAVSSPTCGRRTTRASRTWDCPPTAAQHPAVATLCRLPGHARDLGHGGGLARVLPQRRGR
jgi:MFS family permease